MKTQTFLDFEKGVAELAGKVAELKAVAASSAIDVAEEAQRLEARADQMLAELYADLTPERKVLVARHPQRPHALDFVRGLFTEYTPLAGDRNFAEDHAMIGGLARFRDRACMVVGIERGHDLHTRIERNFGMARPEGYRKAVRLMQLADRFALPVITLVDTPGAYPGKGAEERGQAEAIARATACCLEIGVPLISVVIGEGGSGGAVALASANRLAMLEHAVYSVISPEGCASILWKSSAKMKEAASALRITATDLAELGVVDRVVAEPVGGAQRDPEAAIVATGDVLAELLEELSGMGPTELRADRRRKFINLGDRGLAG